MPEPTINETTHVYTAQAIEGRRVEFLIPPRQRVAEVAELFSPELGPRFSVVRVIVGTAIVFDSKYPSTGGGAAWQSKPPPWSVPVGWGVSVEVELYEPLPEPMVVGLGVRWREVVE